jgi:hypothetical protein
MSVDGQTHDSNPRSFELDTISLCETPLEIGISPSIFNEYVNSRYA